MNVGGGQPSGDYLPLTAGPSAPLTGKLYINAGARLLNNKALYGLTSEGNEYPLIHMSSNNTIKVGSIHSPIEITSEVSDVCIIVLEPLTKSGTHITFRVQLPRRI